MPDHPGLTWRVDTMLEPIGAPNQARIPWLSSSRREQPQLKLPTFPSFVNQTFLFPGPAWKGLGSKFGHLDSGPTLHFPVNEFPEKTESSCFIDTRVIYRSARNDDYRDDSLWKRPKLKPSPLGKRASPKSFITRHFHIVRKNDRIFLIRVSTTLVSEIQIRNPGDSKHGISWHLECSTVILVRAGLARQSISTWKLSAKPEGAGYPIALAVECREDGMGICVHPETRRKTYRCAKNNKVIRLGDGRCDILLRSRTKNKVF